MIPHGPAVDMVLAEEAVSSLSTPGQVRWMLADNQGTVRDVAVYNTTTHVTSIVDHLTYGVFGNMTENSGHNQAYDPTFTFTGREYDADADLYYYRARWYDAVNGRFISEDPLGLAAGDVNLYRYTHNDPVNFRDPSGLFEQTDASNYGGCAGGGGMDGYGGMGMGGAGGPRMGGAGGSGMGGDGGMGVGGDGDSDSDSFGACFAEGTPVLMADGTWKKIEEIQPGETVLSASEHDPEGKVDAKSVVQVYHNKPQPMVELSVDGGVIRTTPNHPFYVRGKGFTPAAELESGCQFRGHNGQLVELKQKTITDKIELVFNIHVADNHTYFVGESNRKTSVLVHNQSGGMSQDGTGPDPVTAGNVIGAHGTFPYYPLFGENSPFLPQPTDVRAGGSYDVSKGSGSLNVALGWGNSFLIFVNENNIPNQMQVGGGVQMNLPWLPGFGMSGERRPDGKYEGGLYYIHRH